AVAAGLVLGGGLVIGGLGLGGHALLHGLVGVAHVLDGDDGVALGVAVLQRLDHRVDVERLAAFDGLAAQLVTQRVAQLPLFGSGVNRKSTRLNSSHVKISYAVFCLKKKNTIEID